ncbi:MAG: His/Gly/Thr/Pro-type tRNA ligase C-terminal domain-containing protein [bacterium]|nr:His/Gly/Thr/Pro-type tRNA ligase C-terminal domain-containing protein [bacterium]
MASHTKTTARTQKKKSAGAKSYIEYKDVDPGVETALYYGFTPLDTPLTIVKEDREKARELGYEDRTEPSTLGPTIEEKVALLRHYEEKNLSSHAQPIMFCTELLSGGTGKKHAGERRISFEIMGTGKSIAEATLIQTAFATLREEGHTELTLTLNSVGDRESMNRFLRELGNYYRKHIALLPQSCKTLLRKNPLDLLKCTHEKCALLAESAPKSIGSLGDESRRHFKEVLEFLEELQIPYRIDPGLIGNRLFATETLFEIRETLHDGTERLLCAGTRYNGLGKRLGHKKEVPSIGMNLRFMKEVKENPATRRIRFRKPSIFFLQLGFCAKLKSLRVIEMMRQVRIPLYQALNRDKLLSQISSAENLRIPYSIILGQREALENSVIVRNTSSRAQETIKLKDLTEYFKKMKLG